MFSTQTKKLYVLYVTINVAIILWMMKQYEVLNITNFDGVTVHCRLCPSNTSLLSALPLYSRHRELYGTALVQFHTGTILILNVIVKSGIMHAKAHRMFGDSTDESQTNFVRILSRHLFVYQPHIKHI